MIAGLDDLEEPPLAHVAPPVLQTGHGITWKVERDVLARKTSCRTAHSEKWLSSKGFACENHYRGLVELDTRNFDQRAEADAGFEVDFPEGRTLTQSTLTLLTNATHFDIEVLVETFENGEPFASKHWHRSIPRDLA